MNAMLRLAAWLVAVALVALPVVAVLRGWIGAEQWPLRTLRAQGEFEYVDAARVRGTLLPYAKHGFFAVDLQAAQAAVAALPWVERAEVRKRWPDVLEVRITEHRPYAHWGADRLLSQRGRLFSARGAKVPRGLPRLGGPEARTREVVELYQQTRELFVPVGMVVEGVELDPRGSWSVRLRDRANGGAPTRVIVGRNEARARIGRFVRLLPQLLATPGRRVELADLRYTNGFALTWAQVPESANGKPGARASSPPSAVPANPRVRDEARAPLAAHPRAASRYPVRAAARSLTPIPELS